MITLPPFVTEFMQTFATHDYQIYVVGGPVRDMLLGKTSTNWDFTTNATPEQMLRMFPHAFYHNTYGTVTIPHHETEGDMPIMLEVTPFRTEGTYTDGRHPDEVVWAKTVEEDLGRRDFTINAIAYDGNRIVDPYDGQGDIKKRLIRAVGEPTKRFKEDALRLLRGVRFSAQLAFFIDEETRRAMTKEAGLIAHVSGERIRDEFLKILSSEYPYDGVMMLKSTGLLKYILPELDAAFDVGQVSPNRHHIYDVGTHSVMTLKFCKSEDPITRFAALIHDVGKVKTYHKEESTGQITFYNHEVVGAKQAEVIADRFRLSNAQKDKLVRLVAYHQFTVTEEATDSAIRRFIRNVGKENLEDMLALRVGDRLGSGARETSWRLDLFRKRLAELLIEPFTIADLKISGHDVMKELDLKPGKEVGEILNKIFAEVEEKKVPNEREALLAKILEYKK